MKIKTYKVKSKLARVQIIFDAGSKVESKTKFPAGTAHMLEHMFFKGTEKRSAADISSDISYYGGFLNAFTSHESIYFELHAPVENIDECLEILSDMIINPKLSEDDFEKEVNVVLEEEAMDSQSPDSVLFENAMKLGFSNYLSNPIIGTEESIKKITIKHLRKYKERFLTINNALVLMTSSMTNKDASSMLKKHFGKATGRFKKNFKFEKSEFPETDSVHYHFAGLDQSSFILIFPGVSSLSKLSIPAKFIAAILAGGPGSRLFNILREDNGLVYELESQNIQYKNDGIFFIHFVCNTKNEQKALDIIADEIERFSLDGPTDLEITKAKNMFKTGLYEVEEDTSSVIKFKRRLLLGESKSIEDVTEMVMNVTAEDIKEATYNLFGSGQVLKLFCSGEDRE